MVHSRLVDRINAIVDALVIHAALCVAFNVAFHTLGLALDAAHAKHVVVFPFLWSCAEIFETQLVSMVAPCWILR